MSSQYQPPTTVREMTDADCHNYGVDREDYPQDRLWLAIWPDRSGYYAEGLKPDVPECRFCASIYNESEIFGDSDSCHAWMWERLEVTTPRSLARLSLTFTTKGGRKLLGRNLDAVRANGDHPLLERYYDEAGTAELACSTDEREDYERETRRKLKSDTLTAEVWAALGEWMMNEAGLRVDNITTKDST